MTPASDFSQLNSDPEIFRGTRASIEPACHQRALPVEPRYPRPAREGSDQDFLQSERAISGSLVSTITGRVLHFSAFSSIAELNPEGRSSTSKIASSGHSGTHAAQSIHSSGSIQRVLGPSWKQSTGQTATHTVCLQSTQRLVTTCGMD